MLDLIKKRFKAYYSQEEDLKEIDSNSGINVYIRSKDFIICITIDFKDDDFDVFIERDISKFNQVPLPLHTMEAAMKNKKYVDDYNEICNKAKKQHFFKKAEMHFEIIEKYINGGYNQSI